MMPHLRSPLVASLALVTFVCGGTGCGVLDFDVEQTIPAQTIRGSGIPDILTPLADIFPLLLTIDLGSQFEAKDTGPVDSVTLSSLALQITSSDGDWRFVTRVDVLVESAKSTSSLPKRKIASVSPQGTTRALAFAIEPDVDLKPYIDDGAQVTSRCTGTLPFHDVTFSGKAVFTVHPL